MATVTYSSFLLLAFSLILTSATCQARVGGLITMNRESLPTVNSNHNNHDNHDDNVINDGHSEDYLRIDAAGECNQQGETKDSYLKRRLAMMGADVGQMMGHTLTLSDKEQKVNQVLMGFKKQEMARYRSPDNKTMFPPATHFFFAKEDIDQSRVFQMITQMPKGGLLHIHDMAVINMHWLIQNATYDNHCYMCVDPKGQHKFRFFLNPPTHPEEGCTEWENVIEARKRSGNATEFDNKLYEKLTMITPKPYEKYTDQNVVWDYFMGCFVQISGLFSYEPVFRAFYMESLREILKDHVQYLELRVVLLPLYDLDGTERDRNHTVKVYKEVTDQFLGENPTFIGAKIIFTSIRSMDQSVIESDIKCAIQLMENFPGFVAGYDLVSHEDPGHPLKYFLDQLLSPSQAQPKVDLPFFFHAGETNWQGEDVDENLLDAVLLNTTRIGHGYAIPKHPAVMKAVREHNIAIEVNPISNQVLLLVNDLRNHAMVPLIAQDFPIVISSDDPGLWGALPLSHDFYEAFMGMAGAHADLRMLKQCAINSIKYSAMSDADKKRGEMLWSKQWDLFIDKMLDSHNLLEP